MLKQNYPNPFNPSTSIEFKLNVTSLVTLEIFDIKGKKVETLLNNETMSSGIYKVNFTGDNLSSGVYFYNIRTDKGVNDTRTMLLVK